jgi:hypothetical protein
MPDRDAHRLPGTFRPGPMVLEADGHVVGVRWQPFIKRHGRRRATVEGTSKVDVLGVLEHDLVVSTRGVGRGRSSGGGTEVGEGRVVN